MREKLQGKLEALLEGGQEVDRWSDWSSRFLHRYAPVRARWVGKRYEYPEGVKGHLLSSIVHVTQKHKLGGSWDILGNDEVERAMCFRSATPARCCRRATVWRGWCRSPSTCRGRCDECAEDKTKLQVRKEEDVLSCVLEV